MEKVDEFILHLEDEEEATDSPKKVSGGWMVADADDRSFPAIARM